MSKIRKLMVARVLIVYMVTALLFLTSVELHIHTDGAAPASDHGHAVSISTLDDSFAPQSGSEEIKVGVESVLKIKNDNVSFLVVFILIAVLLTTLRQIFIGHLREKHIQFPSIPYRGLPPLRAPPL